MEEGITDRFGNPITTSSWERFRGQQNEWDANRPQVKIVQNVSLLEVELFTWMVDCVNDRPLWGLPPRCVKLSNVSWEEKFYGQCYKYFTRTLEFDLNRKTWDRKFLDESNKVLKGRWTTDHHWSLENVNGLPPDYRNPAHFIQFTDFSGNPITGVLNGYGLPAGVCVDNIPTNLQLVLPSPVFIYYSNTPLSGTSVNDELVWAVWKPIEEITSSQAINGPYYPWLSTIRYEKGNVATRGGGLYLALAESYGEDPTFSQQTNWKLLPSGLSNETTYNSATTYALGDYVQKACVESGTGTGVSMQTVAGYRKVEKYFQANFFLLEVPVIIGQP